MYKIIITLIQRETSKRFNAKILELNIFEESNFDNTFVCFSFHFIIADIYSFIRVFATINIYLNLSR